MEWRYVAGGPNNDRWVMQSEDDRFLLIGEYESGGGNNVKRTIKVVDLMEGPIKKEEIK